MDFPLRISPLLAPLLRPFGVRGPAAVARLEQDRLHLHFGALLDHGFALTDIEHVRRSSWPWWMGMGLRIGLDHKLGLIGSLRGVVCIHFREPVRVQALLPLHSQDLFLSLRDPDGFIAACDAALANLQARAE